MLNPKQKKIAIAVIAIVVVVIGYYYINSTKQVYTQNYDIGETKQEEETNEDEKKPEKEKAIMVHITGAVNKNGIVEIKEDARIDDVITAAGGITEDADLSDVNLAYKIEDGQKIYIPSIDDKKITETGTQNIGTEGRISNTVVFTNAGTGVIQEEEKGSSSKVNINKASMTELMALPGVGEATAVRIIEYRKTHGNFRTIEDIKNVSGIGDAKYNTIKDSITV